jgi:hypothetical protein
MRLTKLCMLLTVMLAVTSCDDFVVAHYVPVDFSPSTPVDASKLVAELQAFGAKYGMKCKDFPSQSQAKIIYICNGTASTNSSDGSYRVIVSAGYPQLEYFDIGPQLFLFYPHFNCDHEQAAREALEEFTGPLKLDGTRDDCAQRSGDSTHG